ncbi:hypothetical protein TELCIR_13249 [Teladorsagia circumcincta]|uniref:Uncharacterized protein n=1 Tax=Teladorsagia circumcincta TaxID=45464 RepID=A0A2G9U4C1_TELCI|nr:hypothetical protein TELCIR_13249 [Teladorsagia circumcincta]
MERMYTHSKTPNFVMTASLSLMGVVDRANVDAVVAHITRNQIYVCNTHVIQADSEYQPSGFESDCNFLDTTEHFGQTDEADKQKYFLVNGEKLLELMRFSPECGHRLGSTQLGAVGTAAVVRFVCGNCSVRYPLVKRIEHNDEAYQKDLPIVVFGHFTWRVTSSTITNAGREKRLEFNKKTIEWVEKLVKAVDDGFSKKSIIATPLLPQTLPRKNRQKMVTANTATYLAGLAVNSPSVMESWYRSGMSVQKNFYFVIVGHNDQPLFEMDFPIVDKKSRESENRY